MSNDMVVLYLYNDRYGKCYNVQPVKVNMQDLKFLKNTVRRGHIYYGSKGKYMVAFAHFVAPSSSIASYGQVGTIVLNDM